MITPRELLDRTAIERTLRRYSQGVDQRDWDLYARAFTPDAEVDIPGYLEKPLSAKDFATFLGGTFDHNRISGQHVLGNTLYLIDGERARTVTEFLAVTTERVVPDDGAQAERSATEGGDVLLQHSGGLYVDDLLRTADEWLISRRKLVRKSDTRRIVRYTPQLAALTAGAARNPVVHGL